MDQYLGDEVTWKEALEQTYVCAARLRLAPDAGWLMSTGGKVLTMQAGFGLLEAAMTRKMNAANIMMKNVGDLVLGAIIYYFLGFNLSYGEVQDHGFAGRVDTEATDYSSWFFQFSFAATAATIDSGTLAERCNFFAYVILSTITTGIIYPIAAHWGWGGGFLSQDGFMDFAGSTIVHALGASGGLAASLFCGPRIARFKHYKTWQNPILRKIWGETRTSIFYRHPVGIVEEDNFVTLLPITNPVQTLFGTLLLWMGWYGFNGGSTLGVTGDLDMQAAKVFVTTTLAAAAGGVAGFVISMAGHARSAKRPIVQVPDLCTAILGGLVCITAGCAWVSPVNSCIIGFIGGASALFCTQLLERHQIDDVVSAIPVHGFAGIIGTALVAFFAEPDCAAPDITPGIFYGGDWAQLGIQMKGIACICSWGFCATYSVCLLLDQIPHLSIRAERWDEIIGMDLVEHFYDDNFDYQEEKSRTLIAFAAHQEPVKSFLFGNDSPELEAEFQEWDKKMHDHRLDQHAQDDVFKMMGDKVIELEKEVLHLKDHEEFSEKRFRRIEKGFQKRLEKLEFSSRQNTMHFQKLELNIDELKKGVTQICKAVNALQKVDQAAQSKPKTTALIVCANDTAASVPVEQVSDEAFMTRQIGEVQISFTEDTGDALFGTVLEGSDVPQWLQPPLETVQRIQSWWRGCAHRMKDRKGKRKPTITFANLAKTIVFGGNDINGTGITEEQILQLKISTEISKQGGTGRNFHATTWRHDTCGKHFPQKPKRDAGAGSGGWMGMSDGKGSRRGADASSAGGGSAAASA